MSQQRIYSGCTRCLHASPLQNVALKSDEDHMFTLRGKHEMGFHQTERSRVLTKVLSGDENKRANVTILCGHTTNSSQN